MGVCDWIATKTQEIIFHDINSDPYPYQPSGIGPSPDSRARNLIFHHGEIVPMAIRVHRRWKKKVVGLPPKFGNEFFRLTKRYSVNSNPQVLDLVEEFDLKASFRAPCARYALRGPQEAYD